MSLPLTGAGRAAAGGGGGGATDPFWSSVTLLAEFEGTDGQSSGYTAETGQSYTFAAGQTLDTEQVTSGVTALKNTSGNQGTFPQSSGFDLSAANSDEFTIEFLAWQPNTAGTPVWMNANWSNDGWFVRGNGTAMEFWWVIGSGASSANVIKASAGFTTNTWQHWCVEKNSSGKIRFYLDGVMVHSDTPADSTIEATTGVMLVHSGTGYYLDHIRITKGVARYDSDGGYTPSSALYPTQ
jgi:hypothetical protein